MHTHEHIPIEQEQSSTSNQAPDCAIETITDSEGKETITAETLHTVLEQQADNITVIDVRTKEEYDHEHISGTENHPLPSTLEEIKDTAQKLDKGGLVIAICQSGGRSDMATSILPDFFKKGSCCKMIGVEKGLNAWKDAGYKTEGEQIH